MDGDADDVVGHRFLSRNCFVVQKLNGDGMTSVAVVLNVEV
jgi:hypothetical protein